MTQPPDKGQLLKSACWYARERKWPVVALHSILNGRCTCSRGSNCGTPGKHPRWDKELLPHGVRSATTDLDVIRKWWAKWPDANVGIATGNLCFDALDIDLKGNGPETLKDLETQYGRLPDTIEQITGSGGRQIMFAPCGNLRNEVRFAPGLDIRTDGGLVVVPPSVHISGNEYVWEASSRPEEKDLAPVPEWLIKLAGSSNGSKPHVSVNVDGIFAGIAEGSRDHELYRYACRLRHQGLSQPEAECLILSAANQCKPPFPPDQAKKKVAQAWKHPGPEEPEEPKSTWENTDERFPQHAMTGVAGRFAEVFASYTECPAQFYFFAFLTCLGSILADRLTLESQTAPQPRLYTVILGESADDRKSTAIDQTTRFFMNALSVDSEIEKAFSVCHGVGSAEGLQKRFQKTNKVLLVCDEFKALTSKCAIEGSVLLPCLSTLFESNRYHNSTKNSEIALESAYLSILAASTVSTYESCWKKQFTDIGFNNRLFLVTGKGERRFSIPPKIPMPELNSLRYDLSGILQMIREDRLELRLTPDAGEAFHQWYLNIDPSVHTKRLDTYAHRLMALLAVNDLKEIIDQETVDRVIALANWQLSIRKLMDPIDCDNAIGRMEEKIRRYLSAKGPMRERDLKRACHVRSEGLYIFQSAVTNLRKAQELKFDARRKEFFLG